MDFFEAIESRRSVRRYLSQPVPRDVLTRIVHAGAEAPSGCNAHLRHFIVVDDAGVMNVLRGLNQAFDGAPAAIVVAVEPVGAGRGEYWVQDASAAMQSMLLAATALGYAGCWIEGNRANWEQPVRELLKVPGRLRPWAMTPIGKPAAPAPRPPKPGAAAITHFNTW
jgi:nitroreductase